MLFRVGIFVERAPAGVERWSKQRAKPVVTCEGTHECVPQGRGSERMDLRGALQCDDG